MDENNQKILNIIGAIIVVLFNVAISFFLSPYIVEHLGVEVNGYITLANNFISYFTLLSVALNSMASRFILIELKKNNLKSANEYYSSVFFGNLVIAAILIIPCVYIILNISKVLNITDGQVFDTRILFIIVFATFFLPLCLPKWNIATYATNKLYLQSIKNVIAALCRTLTILLLFALAKPHSYYVAIAGLLMALINLVIELYYKKLLLPELNIKRVFYRFDRIKELVSSGIWNTISQCGNILLESLDVLIANIFIDSIASGVLAVSKTVPNMINQIVGSLSVTFGPSLTCLFAENKYDQMCKEMKKNIRLVSFLAVIPIGIMFVFGNMFFQLWVPSQDSFKLSILVDLTLIGILVTGITDSLVYVFSVVNKVRENAIAIIVSGLLNAGVVYILLKNTNLGVYAIAGVSSVISIIRVFTFTLPYIAKCIDQKLLTFYPTVIFGIINVLIPVGIGYIIKLIIPGISWILLVIEILFTALITMLVDYLVLMNRDEKDFIGGILKKIIKKG